MKAVLSLFIFLSLCVAVSAYAQQDTSNFFVRVTVGTDLAPPSTPVLLSATAVAFNQINTTWSASIDDLMVAGYIVSRNGVPVATTTLTSYSDTGLTASTSYTYLVRAFDQSFNYSSTSNSLTVVTPNPPPVVVNVDDGSLSGGSSVARVVLDELNIKVGISTSTFFIKTARPARFEMRWGRTKSYELGSVARSNFSDSYTTTLTDLEPGTTYEYEVTGYTPYGKAFILERGQFTTLKVNNILLPANVNKLRAVADKDDVVLSWNAPPLETYAYVRIVRSNKGFPNHLQDGAVIYQGKGNRAVDTAVLAQFSPAYYTLFVVDEVGNVSSGAIAMVYANKQVGNNQEEVPPDKPLPKEVLEIEPTTASTSPLVPPDTRMPDVAEIFLVQGQTLASFADTSVSIDSAKPFLLSIPKTAVSDNLKTIIVSITDPTDSQQTYSFLLRINKDKTAYEAVLSPVLSNGISRMTITIYDYQSMVVATYKKSIEFITINNSAEAVPIFPDFFIKNAVPLAILTFSLLAIILLCLIFFFRRKKVLREDKI